MLMFCDKLLDLEENFKTIICSNQWNTVFPKLDGNFCGEKNKNEKKSQRLLQLHINILTRIVKQNSLMSLQLTQH